MFMNTLEQNQDTKLINLSDGQVECYRGPDEDYNQATIDAAKPNGCRCLVNWH